VTARLDRPANYAETEKQSERKNLMAAAQVTGKKPNIIMIMSDDVGTWNISAYHRGMMGGRPIWTESPTKAHCSPITTVSSPARQGGRRSSPVKIHSARVS
jgi:hypothetical protein